MAYVAPTIRSVGDAVTAADYNIMANNALQFAPFVQGVFTTEAARDAAITSPTEGMHVYLTAPTTAIVNATGLTAAIPSGVQTIYNGSVWVVTTPIGALSRANGVGISNISTTSTSYTTTATGDTTALTTTLVTGTSARIDLSMTFYMNTSNSAFVSFSVSGATTIAASDVGGLMESAGAPNGGYGTMGGSQIITNLTAGVNVFTFNVRADGGTLYLSSRRIVVQGIA